MVLGPPNTIAVEQLYPPLVRPVLFDQRTAQHFHTYVRLASAVLITI